MQENLRVAAGNGRMDVIIELLQKGVDVDGADEVSHVIKSCVHV